MPLSIFLLCHMRWSLGRLHCTVRGPSSTCSQEAQHCRRTCQLATACTLSGQRGCKLRRWMVKDVEGWLTHFTPFMVSNPRVCLTLKTSVHKRLFQPDSITASDPYPLGVAKLESIRPQGCKRWWQNCRWWHQHRSIPAGCSNGKGVGVKIR